MVLKRAREIWRDWTIDGDNTSGAWNPIKSDIRTWGTALEGNIPPPMGRLTLTAGTRVTPSDVASATSIIYMPCIGNLVPIFKPSMGFVPTIFGSLTLQLTTSHAANASYDLFVIQNSNGDAVLVSGPAYVGNVSGGPIVDLIGLPVNAAPMIAHNGTTVYNVPPNAATKVGGFKVTSVAGQTEDTSQNRYLSNLYNLAERLFKREEAAANWKQTVASGLRQANANPSNAVRWFHCADGIPVEIDVIGTAVCVAPGDQAAVAIGIDGLTSNSTHGFAQNAATGSLVANSQSFYKGYVGIGSHDARWLERVTNNTQTWYGALAPFGGAGMAGKTWN